MKRLISSTALLTVLLISAQSFAQTATELVFRNPQREFGLWCDLGAVYRFKNVTTGTDALLTIAGVSDFGLIKELDLTSTGWDKAFQPEIGKSGNVCGSDNWWVRFNLKFVASNTCDKKRLAKFHATAIDVDGDNHIIREYIQMYNANETTYRNGTQLSSEACFNAGLSYGTGTNHSRGPVTNYTNIDTAATKVMVTYTFLNTDEINFVYGARVSNGTSNAGLRLNSLWFKSFNLNTNVILPVQNTAFNLVYDKKTVSLSWKMTPQDGVNSVVVERSADGINFKEIGEVKISDNQTAYAFTDGNPSSAAGNLYYRLLYREKSLEAKYSDIKLVHLTKTPGTTLTVYPNPVQRTANLTLPFAWQAKPVQVSVYNAAGNLMETQVVKVASQTEILDLSRLPKGMYVVKAQCNGEWAEQRIIKN